MTTVLKKFYNPFVNTFDDVVNSMKKQTKQKMNSSSNTFSIGNKEYIVRVARYGPVIQHDKSFIDLKAYLHDTNKQIDDINNDDIKLLLSLPKQILKDRELCYGRYGFYVKCLDTDKTLRVYKQNIAKVLANNFDFIG